MMLGSEIGDSIRKSREGLGLREIDLPLRVRTLAGIEQ